MPDYHQKNEFGSVAAQRTGNVQTTSRQNVFQESFLNVSFKYNDQRSTDHQTWEEFGPNGSKISFPEFLRPLISGNDWIIVNENE